MLFPFLSLVYKTDPLNASLPILVFNGIQLAIATYKDMTRKEKDGWGIKLSEKETVKNKLLNESGKLERSEGEIQEEESAIVNLYEITKKMSEYLRFEDIFKAFSVFIKENFKFERCDLLILDRETDQPRLDREYTVHKSGGAGGLSIKPDHEKLIRLLTKRPEEIFISKADDIKFFRDFGIDGKTTETFCGIPLMSEKRVVAILAVWNLPKADLEKFVILSAQFALEIRKVLLYEVVEKLAVTDSLTGLYVRRYFLERMNEELNRSRRYKFRFAFLMIDIDNFKRCNDTYGHLVGDVVLKDIARIMKESTREIDLVARYGGEEFAFVLPETGKEGAGRVAERIRKKIEENAFKAYDESLRLTVSAGISVYPDDSRGANELIKRADKALYNAKKSGKNVVYEYER